MPPLHTSGQPRVQAIRILSIPLITNYDSRRCSESNSFRRGGQDCVGDVAGDRNRRRQKQPRPEETHRPARLIEGSLANHRSPSRRRVHDPGV